jgi:hypothetical protein
MKQSTEREHFMTQQDSLDTFDSAIGKAIAHWQEGLPISMTLFAELLEQGYDVPTLENQYMKY